MSLVRRENHVEVGPQQVQLFSRVEHPAGGVHTDPGAQVGQNLVAQAVYRGYAHAGKVLGVSGGLGAGAEALPHLQRGGASECAEQQVSWS